MGSTTQHYVPRAGAPPPWPHDYVYPPPHTTTPNSTQARHLHNSRVASPADNEPFVGYATPAPTRAMLEEDVSPAHARQWTQSLARVAHHIIVHCHAIHSEHSSMMGATILAIFVKEMGALPPIFPQSQCTDTDYSALVMMVMVDLLCHCVQHAPSPGHTTP